MTETNRAWPVGVSMFLAAMAQFPTLAQESLPKPAEAIPDSTATTPTGDARLSDLQMAPYIDPANCRPNRGGRLERWRQHWRDKLWGYPQEFDDALLGAAVETHAVSQIANGRAARMGLYQYDFIPDSDQLKPRGKATLMRIAEWLPGNFCPVFVEPTPGNPELDQARRIAVWQELANGLCPIPSERVIIGQPGIRGLMGAEALIVDKNLLMQTSSRGATAGGGATGAAGASGAGGGSPITTGRGY